MTSALPRLYCGPLEHLAVPTVAAELPDDAMPAERLLEPGVLDDLLERFAAQYQGDDLKAVASLWSKWHFSAMAAHTLASNLLLGRATENGPAFLQRGVSPGGDKQEEVMVVQRGRPTSNY